MCLSGKNPAEPPDSELAKEVYAHFGLCMYLAQVFETGLINLLTMLQRAKLRDSSPEAFDRLYRDNEALTFGNLMKGLDKFRFLPKELADDIQKLKARRDRLAHRYFRDHDLDFVTTGGCLAMVEELTSEREAFANLDARVSRLLDQSYARLGMDPTKVREACAKVEAEMHAEAAARYQKF